MNQNQDPQIPFERMPARFVRCVNGDCAVGSQCLRARAWQACATPQPVVPVLNPALAVGGEQCPHFRSTRPATRPRGFKQLQARMVPAVYATFRDICLGHYAYGPFYRLRSGENYLTPQDEAFVVRAARRAGFEDDITFDAYDEQYDWSD